MTDAPTTPDPIEIAMEAEASGRPPSGIGAEFLVEQKRLTRWQVANERAAFALRMLTALAGVAAAAVLAAMVWQASRSSALVIDAFSVPPDLAARGMTGQVVASRILDRMTAIQSRVDSQRAPSSFSRAWDGGIQVEIPSTGVTLAELSRELRAWVGRDTHISGEVVHTATGLSLTVRAGREPGVTFEGPDDGMADLLTKAGETAYGKAEPYRYANHLRTLNRFVEAEQLFRAQAARGTPSDRGWALQGLGNIARDRQGYRAALRHFNAAARLAPWQFLPTSNQGNVAFGLGHPDRARFYALRAVQKATPRGEIRADLLPAVRGRMLGMAALLDADFQTARRTWTEAVNFGPQGANQSFASRIVWADVGLHEITAAEVVQATPDPSATRATGEGAIDVVLSAVRIAAAREAWADVVRLSDVRAQLARWPGAHEQVACQLEPLAAYAQARLGDLPAAEARIAATPLDCYDAVIFRGRIAELAARRATADHWFAQARTMAPASAFAPQAWAEAKLARGDVADALALARAAAKIAPRWADPRKLEGDALLRTGEPRAAATAYAAAAKLAPRWGGLHLTWGHALARLGRADDARAKRRAAAAMDLTGAERAELARVTR